MTIIKHDGDWENDTVTIPLDEYMLLLQEVKFLHALEKCGVETWEGFETAMRFWRANDS